MSITAKPIINAKFAAAVDTVEYESPSGTYTIIDKFTATNTDSSSRTVNVYLIPSGQSVASDYMIIKTLSIAAAATEDITDLQNQILAPGDQISVIASVASKVVIRASGRAIT